MTAMVRFDLTMDAAEKDVLSRAAALMGTTMAAFVRSAAKEKAKELLDRESRITMTTQDFDAFTQALNRCRIPDDCIDEKRYPLFMARAVMQKLIESLQSTRGETPC